MLTISLPKPTKINLKWLSSDFSLLLFFIIFLYAFGFFVSLGRGAIKYSRFMDRIENNPGSSAALRSKELKQLGFFMPVDSVPSVMDYVYAGLK